jgi:hypothetical protein
LKCLPRVFGTDDPREAAPHAGIGQIDGLFIGTDGLASGESRDRERRYAKLKRRRFP